MSGKLSLRERRRKLRAYRQWLRKERLVRSVLLTRLGQLEVEHT